MNHEHLSNHERLGLFLSGHGTGYMERTVPAGVSSCWVDFGSHYNTGNSDQNVRIVIGGSVVWQSTANTPRFQRSFACSPGQTFRIDEHHSIFYPYEIRFLTYEETETYEYVGCRSGMGWTRSYTPDVPSNDDGVATCESRCKANGFAYFSMECPHGSGTEVHCQCSNSISGTAVPDSYCNGGRYIGHCSGPGKTSKGTFLGGHGCGSIYKVPA